MAKFEYTWNDGSVSSVTLPAETGFSCDYCNPSTAMSNASGLILLNADGSTNEHEIEDYCFQAMGYMDAMYNTATIIRKTWNDKAGDCSHNVGLCYVCRCKDKGIYCYKTRNQLDGCYINWKNLPAKILADKSDLLQKWEDASAKIILDGQQATNWNLLQQLISETNQQLTIVAYDTETKELDVASRKAQQIFAPVIIGMVLIGLGFYLIKK